MIQDAHPLRSGIPDGYVAKYEIDIVAAGVTHTLNQERLPSGFTGVGGTSNTFAGTGLNQIRFPPGMKVRGATVVVDRRNTVAANQINSWVANIDEVNGAAVVVTTINSAPTALADPPTGAVIYVSLDLETV